MRGPYRRSGPVGEVRRAGRRLRYLGGDLGGAARRVPPAAPAAAVASEGSNHPAGKRVVSSPVSIATAAAQGSGFVNARPLGFAAAWGRVPKEVERFRS